VKSLPSSTSSGLGTEKKTVVKMCLAGNGRFGIDPLNCAFHFSSIRGIASTTFRVIGADEFHDFPLAILDHFLAGNIEGILKSHFFSRSEAEVFFLGALP